jgi:D-alanine--poly(phosphoribitol) ligase subunit 1
VATTSIRVEAELLDRWPAVPIGYAMPGTRVVIVDDALRELPDGERGEILIAGPNVSPGYLGQPALTARAFTTFEQRAAYRTGDWGEARDGLLFCAGRMDGQLKVAGYRVEPGDVEANLCALPGVSSAIVLPVLRDGAAVALTAFVVPHEPPAEGEFAAAAALRRQLAERLPSYMLPRRIQFLESFPLTPNGKVDRKVLAERLA